jgi:outer membrane lipoprotein-sorting protein
MNIGKMMEGNAPARIPHPTVHEKRRPAGPPKDGRLPAQSGRASFLAVRPAALIRGCLALLIAGLVVAPASGQEKPGAAGRPDPQRVFRELLAPYRNLNDYTVKIQASVEMPSIRIPNYTATLYFKKPDRFHVETRSFAPIPRDAGVFNPFQFDPEKNRITSLRSEFLNGINADLYRLDPGDKEKRLRYSQAWVGGTPARILQVETISVRGTRALVTLTYRNVEQGGFQWLLPEKVRVRMAFPESAPDNEAASLFSRDNPVSSGIGRLNELTGEGRIDLTYSDWRLNRGLDDSLFGLTPGPP